MMKEKILIYTLMLFFSFSISASAGNKKNKEKGNIKAKEELYDAKHEIDNYDFLYNDSEFDKEYDIATVETIMDEAFSHLGTRYRSGSKGPSSFDCSGFTSYVFAQMDIAIGASSRDQYAKNTPVKKGDLQRGDLVFFTSPGSKRGVGHVGIVVDVDSHNGTFSFIHASSRGGVKVSNSTDGYYSSRYVGARRVI